MTTAVLTDEAVLDAALLESDGNQADLARALEVAQSSISRWRTRKSRPEVESALILARLTGLPRTDVLQAFGHDPMRLGLLDAQEPAPDSRNQLRELGRMLRQFADQIDAMSGGRKPRASQTPTNLQGIPSHTDYSDDYIYQTPVQIWRWKRPYSGDSGRDVPAA